MRVTEGRVDLAVPEQPEDGVGQAVFYNPDQELNRDVTVAALAAYRERNPDAATYLDATTATGARGVRAAANGWTATLADVDPAAVERAEANLARNGVDGEVVHRDARALLYDRKREFDVVDVDPYGSPIPFADPAFVGADRLVCVTATDTAPLCGAHFESGVRRYSTTPRNTEYHAEVGLRVLLGALARTAARYDVGVTPLLSHVSDHYVRTYLDLARSATDANAAVDELGYLYHCPDCLHRETEPGLVADPPETCPACGDRAPLVAGPLWLGPAHEADFVSETRERVREDFGTARRARRLLDRIAGELHVPTHYDQHELTELWGEPATGIEEFLEALRSAGHAASRTHFGGTTFKTDADVAAIRDATK